MNPPAHHIHPYVMICFMTLARAAHFLRKEAQGATGNILMLMRLHTA